MYEQTETIHILIAIATSQPFGLTIPFPRSCYLSCHVFHRQINPLLVAPLLDEAV